MCVCKRKTISGDFSREQIRERHKKVVTTNLKISVNHKFKHQDQDVISKTTQCLKNHRKKSHLTIASVASYVYILSGQELIENAKNGEFWKI